MARERPADRALAGIRDEDAGPQGIGALPLPAGLGASPEERYASSEPQPNLKRDGVWFYGYKRDLRQPGE